MKAPRTLSVAARAVLAHLSTGGTATNAELRGAQRALGDGRNDQALAALPYNLRARGYIEQVPDRTPPRWSLTKDGHAAVARAAKERDTDPPPARTGTAAPPPARLVEFAGRRIPLPAGPRWVFDLAREQAEFIT